MSENMPEAPPIKNPSPKRTRRYDIEEVKQAANGRWLDILTNVGGLDTAVLNGRNHPCPKCSGGDTSHDRFSLVSEERGAVLCRKCFSSRNGDGISAVRWAKNLDLPDSLEAIASYLGLKPSGKNGRGKGKNGSSKGGKNVDPAKDLEFLDWNTMLAQHFLAAKPGVTEESLLANGARRAKWKRAYQVIALPIIGEDLDAAKPVGWVLYDWKGGELPRFDPSGKVIGSSKTKITYGSKSGIMGVHGIERLKVPGLVQQAWKVEGVTDLLALKSIVPATIADKEIVVTNSCGAGETPGWIASLLASCNVNVLHDADDAGVVGAKTWSQAIAAQQQPGHECRNVQLPYSVQENHGKDIRDWINDGNAYADLAVMAMKFDPIVVSRNADGTADLASSDHPAQEMLLKKIGLEVLYENEKGVIRVFSTALKKSTNITRVGQLKRPDLIQIAGSPAKDRLVSNSNDANGEDLFSVREAIEAIALIASSRRGKGDERGVGIWQGKSDDGTDTNAIVLVNNSSAARWNGDKVLRKIVAPRADGLVLDLGSGEKDWYNFDQLAGHLKDCEDVAWRQKVIETTTEVFSRWRWTNQEVSPTLMTGLVLASWIQTIWKWRPLVSLTGESNAGKSLMYECLGGCGETPGVFGNLAFYGAKPTEAGVRQGIHNTAKVPIVDEFESSEQRAKILELLRLSTRGTMKPMGTTGDARGVKYRLCHIGWVAAIETGLEEQPDVNRFIALNLLPALPGQHGKLQAPDASMLLAIGQKLLAVAVYCAIEAKRLALALKSIQVEGIDGRTVESYGVPAGILATAEGMSDAEAEELLLWLLQCVDKAEQGHTDQELLIDEIMSSRIVVGGRYGSLSVSQIVSSPMHLIDYGSVLESHGIVCNSENGLFIATSQVKRQLLRDSLKRRGQRIDQILLRLPGAEKGRLRINGAQPRGITLPSLTPEEIIENGLNSVIPMTKEEVAKEAAARKENDLNPQSNNEWDF